MTHKLLARQLRQHFGSAAGVPEAMGSFIASVESAYVQSDDDRSMLEHSLETMSEELVDRFRLLNTALAESRQAEGSINQALSALTATLESTADGILVVDAAGSMVHMNQKFVEIWRIPADIHAARDEQRALDFVLDQLADPEQFLAKVRDLYAHPEAESFDILHFKDGRVCERYSRAQHVDGETVGRVWSFRDITAQRQLEGQLRQSQKMEAIGQLAGGVAHDFNNLLTVIMNYATFVLEAGVRGGVADDVREIQAAAERAAGLTRQLLAFSRQQLLQPRVLDLNAVVLGLVPMLRRMIGEDIGITTNTDAQLGPVLADQGQIEQVLMNLAVNARDAMPGGGTITIETSSVELGGWRAGDVGVHIPSGSYSMLAVSDTGCGMDATIRARVFEPFFTTKETGHGTGLGLATVFGIVKQSAGFIWLYSEVGHGTTFKVYLPQVVAAANDVAKAMGPSSSPNGTETILLVEDEDSVRRLTCRVLTRQGYLVIEARNGAEALALVSERGRAIDLVITDVVMPQLNGGQLAAQIRGICPTLRVIYMSGYTDSDIVRRGLLDPQVAFIQKPFTADALANTVRQVLDAVDAVG